MTAAEEKPICELAAFSCTDLVKGEKEAYRIFPTLCPYSLQVDTIIGIGCNAGNSLTHHKEKNQDLFIMTIDFLTRGSVFTYDLI